MNYKNPDDDEHEDNPEDWLASMLILTRAIGFLIPEGKGIVVDLKGDMIDLCPGIKRVIVINSGNQIVTMSANERTDLKEGDWVTSLNEKEMMN